MIYGRAGADSGGAGELYRTNGPEEKAQQALAQAAEIVQARATKIDDESLRAEFLTAEPIRRVLAAGGSERGGRI